MSGLDLCIKVLSHDKKAIENMLDFRVSKNDLPEWQYTNEDFTTIRELFFSECNIEKFGHTDYIYSISAGNCALLREYALSVQLVARALNGRGVVFAQGFDDGSGEGGAVIWAWNHVLADGDAIWSMKPLKKSREYSNVTFEFNEYIELSRSRDYLKYYERFLPADMKDEYQGFQIDAVRQRETTCQNERADFVSKQWRILDRIAAKTQVQKSLEIAGKAFAFHNIFFFEEDYECYSEYSPKIEDIFKEKLDAHGAIITNGGLEDYYVWETGAQIEPSKRSLSDSIYCSKYRSDEIQHITEAELWKALMQVPDFTANEAAYHRQQAKKNVAQRAKASRQKALDHIKQHIRVDDNENQSNPDIKGMLFCLYMPYRTFYPNVINMPELLQKELRNRGAAFIHTQHKSLDYIVYDERYGLSDTYASFVERNSIKTMTLDELWRVIISTPELCAKELAKLPTNKEIRQQKKAAQIQQEIREKEERKLQRQKAREDLQRQKAEERLRKQEQLQAQKAQRLAEEKQRRDEKMRRAEEEKQRQEQEKERQRRQAAAERERKIQLNVLYRPGEEPANIRKRINILFPKLDTAYPDKRISGLNNEHKKWGESVTELYRALGYPDSRAFLESYGYTVVENKGGRPTSNNYAEAIAELQRRYPNGAGKITVEELKLANSDLPIKSLQNSVRKLFGIPLSKYLKEIGIIDNE